VQALHARGLPRSVSHGRDRAQRVRRRLHPARHLQRLRLLRAVVSVRRRRSDRDADYTESRHFVSDGRTHDDATQTHGGVAGKCTLCYDRQKIGSCRRARRRARPNRFSSATSTNCTRARRRASSNCSARRRLVSLRRRFRRRSATSTRSFLLTDVPEAYNLPVASRCCRRRVSRPVRERRYRRGRARARRLRDLPRRAMSATESSARARSRRVRARRVATARSFRRTRAGRTTIVRCSRSRTGNGKSSLYLFMGGVMGGSGILTALADERGDDAALARSARYVAFALASTCPIVLIKHLGRPERFLTCCASSNGNRRCRWACGG
jgi:hypothetical protein